MSCPDGTHKYKEYDKEFDIFLNNRACARGCCHRSHGYFAPIELDEEDVRAIVKASGYDIKKCREAKAVYDVQREPIKNAMGWLKSAVMKGYKIIPRIPPAKNSFNNFENQIYDAETIDALERPNPLSP